MYKLILFSFFVLLWQPALGAKKKKYWYKVESETKQKTTSNNPDYPYDSLESDNKKITFHEVGFWPNQSNVAVGGGFFADEDFFKESKTNRWFISSHITFRNRSWHRIMAGASLIQNNTLFVDAAWHYLPSRKRIRDYYGFGVAHSIYSQDQFRSLLKSDNYFVTACYGIELLKAGQRGLRGEAKALVGSETYGIQLSVSYIFHL